MTRLVLLICYPKSYPRLIASRNSMKLKTLVKHLIMQHPYIFSNALEVYNHLFYVIGNGYRWKGGELQKVGRKFKRKSEEECIQDMINWWTDSTNQFISSWTKKKNDGRLREELVDRLISVAERRLKEHIEKETYIIKHAKELSEDFSVPDDTFQFYPICKGYSACTIIPNNVKPDWLDGINKINEIREKLIKENPRLDPQYERKDSQN